MLQRQVGAGGFDYVIRTTSIMTLEPSPIQ